MTNAGTKHRPVLLVAAGILALLLAGCGLPDLGDSEAALALEAIARGGHHSRLSEQTPAPLRRNVAYRIEDREHIADVYYSGLPARAGIVLVPGLVARGKDDPRLVALANTLARLQFAVVVPEIPGMRELKVRGSDVEAVTDATRYLLDEAGLAPPAHVGIAGFSYAAGPVMLAALQEDIRDRVSFVLSVGGYYDLESVVRFFTTGYYGEHNAFRLEPHPYIKWAFTQSNIELLERHEDREALYRYADEISRGDATSQEEDADMAKDARNLYRLLNNDDPERVHEYLQGLPARMLSELRAVNPAEHDLSMMQATVIILHGKNDTLIPYTESLALAAALPEDKVHLYILEGLFHVNIRAKREDLPHLLQIMELLLAQRQ